jgi:hypothetical protein
VAGTEDQGTLDAVNNVEDFLATFAQDILVAQGGQFLMFLDVEGLPKEGNPSLSVDYYTGWAKTLVSHSNELTNNAVTITPCVYARQLDNVTWNNLIAANNNGIGCGGAWVARYPFNTCDLPEFDDKFAIPGGLNLPFDVLIWQYAEACAKAQLTATKRTQVSPTSIMCFLENWYCRQAPSTRSKILRPPAPSVAEVQPCQPRRGSAST